MFREILYTKIYIMKKIEKLKNAKKLNSTEQRAINGGLIKQCGPNSEGESCELGYPNIYWGCCYNHVCMPCM
jgi:hypothetical protein